MSKTRKGRRVLNPEWRELDGPTVSQPTREGFGTSLITRTLAHAPGAAVRLDYPPEGVTCRIAVPL